MHSTCLPYNHEQPHHVFLDGNMEKEVPLPKEPALNVDVVHIVLEHVFESCPSTIRSLSLVNRCFNVAALPFVHRRMSIKFNGPFDTEPSERVTALLSMDPVKTVALQYIRELHLDCTPVWTKFDRSQPIERLSDKWVPVAQLIAKISMLKEVTFSCREQFPLFLIEVLQRYHPRIKLKILNWTRADPSAPPSDPAEVALARSSMLHTLTTTPFGDDRCFGPDLRGLAFDRIVALAPNLKSVQMHKKFSRESTQTAEEREEAQVRFKVVDPVIRQLDELKLNGFWLTGDSIREWAKRFDLGRVERLELWHAGLHNCSLAIEDYPTTAFHCLKHLHLQVSGFASTRSALPAFIAACTHLETLSLWSRDDDLPLAEALAHHGSSLRTLALHRQDLRDTPDQRPMRLAKALRDLEAIRNACPRLTDLSVDIVRTSSGDEERVLFATLAAFPALRRVRLFCDAGDVTQGTVQFDLAGLPTPGMVPRQERGPDLILNHFVPGTCAFVNEAWHAIADTKEGLPLQELHVKIGEWDRAPTNRGRPDTWVVGQDFRRYYVAKAEALGGGATVEVGVKRTT